MTENNIKNIFIHGPINPLFVSESIQKHSSKFDIGGHSIFLGQVRGDKINNKKITAIEYTANEAMALKIMHGIREELFAKYQISCMHVHHSIGIIKAGELCLFVLTSAPHRKAAIDSCDEAVERIKKTLPVWGKEFFEDETYQWKINR